VPLDDIDRTLLDHVVGAARKIGGGTMPRAQRP
jgi:hypothetical protein